MTNQFKPGQQVIYLLDPSPEEADEISRYGMYTVREQRTDWPTDIFLEGVKYSYATKNFRPINWTDVQPGDDVSFTIEGRGSFSLITVGEDWEGWPTVFDIPAKDLPDSWVITSIDRPEPKPKAPETIGSVVSYMGIPWGRKPHEWVSLSGSGSMSPASAMDANAFIVLFDAGKKDDK